MTRSWCIAVAAMASLALGALDVGGGDIGKSHSSIRFDYTDVAPPPAVN